MSRILIIEDEENLANFVNLELKHEGYETDVELDGRAGLDAALNQDFDVILLDLMLPELNGIEVARRVRELKDTPIIIMTARDSVIDRVSGLDHGADDYIVKPFNPSELIARVKSQIANYERLTQGAQKKENLLQIENLMIDLNSHEVFLDGESLVLPNKEFELLVFLAKNPNIVFSKDQLFEKIWGLDAIGEISTVTVHINRIREKIEKDSANPKFIETVWGSGYRFRKY